MFYFEVFCLTFIHLDCVFVASIGGFLVLVINASFPYVVCMYVCIYVCLCVLRSVYEVAAAAVTWAVVWVSVCL